MAVCILLEGVCNQRPPRPLPPRAEKRKGKKINFCLKWWNSRYRTLDLGDREQIFGAGEAFQGSLVSHQEGHLAPLRLPLPFQVTFPAASSTSHSSQGCEFLHFQVANRSPYHGKGEIGRLLSLCFLQAWSSLTKTATICTSGMLFNRSGIFIIYLTRIFNSILSPVLV